MRNAQTAALNFAVCIPTSLLSNTRRRIASCTRISIAHGIGIAIAQYSILLKGSLGTLSPPVNLEIEDIVSLIPVSDNIVELLRLDTSIEIQITVDDAFLAADLFANLRASWVQEEAGSLRETVDGLRCRRMRFDDRICSRSASLSTCKCLHCCTSHMLVHKS